MQIDENGTIPATALKQIKAGGDNVGLKTYDPVRGPCSSAFAGNLC